MSKIDETEVIRRVQMISEINPSSASTLRAMERTREAILKRMEPRPIWMRRIVVPAGIAAALLLAVTVAWIGLTPRPLSAAEFLEEVAAINSAYKGWIYVRPEPTSTQPVATTATGIAPGWHVNTADGTWAIIGASNGITSIRIDSPPRDEHVTYDTATNEIRLGDMNPFNVAAFKRTAGMLPTDLFSELALFKEKTGGQPLRIDRRQDGGADRIDITYYDDPKLAQAALEGNSHIQCVPMTATLWVDPQTRLIHRMTTLYVGRYEDGIRQTAPITTLISYDGPDVSDVYAAGAPRDAKVIDRRLQGEARQIMDRLDRRAAKGLGDGIAVLTQSYCDKNGTPGRDGNLRLFGYQGPARFFSEFLIMQQPAPTGRNHMGVPQISTPVSWPTPDVHEMLAQLSPNQAAMFFVNDGWHAWGGTIWNQFKKPGPVTDDVLRLWYDCDSPAALFRDIWPSRQTLNLFDVGLDLQILHDDANPNRIGLQIRTRCAGFDDPAVRLRGERIHWIDTNRDDLPIETVMRSFASDETTVTSETRRVFLGYALWPDGRWMPTRWRETATEYDNGKPKPAPEYQEEYTLQFYPNLKADPRWFADPTPWIDQAYRAAKDASPNW